MKVKEIKANGTYMVTSVERCTRIHGAGVVSDACIGRPLSIRSSKMMMHEGKMKRHYLLNGLRAVPFWAFAEDMTIYDPTFLFTPDQLAVYKRLNIEIESLSKLLTQKFNLERSPNRIPSPEHRLLRLDFEIEIDFARDANDDIDFISPRIVVHIDMYSDWLNVNEQFVGTSHKVLWEHIKTVFKKEISKFDAGTAWLRKAI